MYAQKQFSVFKSLFFTVVVIVSSVTASHYSCYRDPLLPRTRLTNASMLVLATAPFKRCQMKLYFSSSQNCSSGCIMYLINSSQVRAFQILTQSTKLLRPLASSYRVGPSASFCPAGPSASFCPTGPTAYFCPSAYLSLTRSSASFVPSCLLDLWLLDLSTSSFVCLTFRFPLFLQVHEL